METRLPPLSLWSTQKLLYWEKQFLDPPALVSSRLCSSTPPSPSNTEAWYHDGLLGLPKKKFPLDIWWKLHWSPGKNEWRWFHQSTVERWKICIDFSFPIDGSFWRKKLFAPKKWAMYTMHFLHKNTFFRRISSAAGVSPPFTRRILWLCFCNHPLALSTPLTHQPPWLCRWRGSPPRHGCPLTHHLQCLQFVIFLTYPSFRGFLCIFG